ncbi:MAG: hypothetical protein K2P95_00760, partial [Hyphomonadaceae bacterium]|nr:hypothetical protein [Hyphomonadaceae bacterium]
MAHVHEGERLPALRRVLAEDALRAGGEARMHAAEAASAAEVAAGLMQSMLAVIGDLRVGVKAVGDQAQSALSVSSQVSVAAEQTSAVIAELSASVSEIQEALAHIDRIASRTNLLALNATIEAARAGEAGRGFAIVAGEVKALSVQTAEAAVRVRARVAGIHGVAKRSGEALGAIGASAAEA